MSPTGVRTNHLEGQNSRLRTQGRPRKRNPGGVVRDPTKHHPRAGVRDRTAARHPVNAGPDTSLAPIGGERNTPVVDRNTPGNPVPETATSGNLAVERRGTAHPDVANHGPADALPGNPTTAVGGETAGIEDDGTIPRGVASMRGRRTTRSRFR